MGSEPINTRARGGRLNPCSPSTSTTGPGSGENANTGFSPTTQCRENAAAVTQGGPQTAISGLRIGNHARQEMAGLCASLLAPGGATQSGRKYGIGNVRKCQVSRRRAARTSWGQTGFKNRRETGSGTPAQAAKCQLSLSRRAPTSWGRTGVDLGPPALHIGPVSGPGPVPSVFRLRACRLAPVKFAAPAFQGEAFAGLTLPGSGPAGFFPGLREDLWRKAPAGQDRLHFRRRWRHGLRFRLSPSALFPAQQAGLLLTNWRRIRHAGTRACAR